MPFALLVYRVIKRLGPLGLVMLAALAFLMTGLGLHMTQTAALPSKRSRDRRDKTTCRCTALRDVFVGHGSICTIDWMAAKRFHNPTLIRVVQGAALAGLLLNLVALEAEHVIPMTKEQRSAPRRVLRKLGLIHGRGRKRD